MVTAQIVTEELFGKFDHVDRRVGAVIGTAGGNRDAMSMAGIALSLAGQREKVRPLMDDLAKRYPNDTLVNEVLLPTVGAAADIARGTPTAAVEALEVTRRFEFGEYAGFWPNYFRGLAYLREGAGKEAAAEFQRILDHRGVDPTSLLYPLSQLGLARGAALTGDTARSRKAYEDLFALWKEADSDLPVLQGKPDENTKNSNEPVPNQVFLIASRFVECEEARALRRGAGSINIAP